MAIRFIRKNGHVIPIGFKREKEDNHNAKIAAAGSVGTGIATYAGVKAGSLEVKAEKAKASARKFRVTASFLQKHVGKNAGTQDFAKATKYHHQSKRFSIKASHTRDVGYLASSALLSYAANKALSQTKLKDDEAAREAVSVASGVGATAIIHAGVTSKKFGIRSGLKQTARYGKKIAAIGIKFAKRRF